MGKKSNIKKPPVNQGSRIKLPNEEEVDSNKLPPHFSFEHIQKNYEVADCTKEQQIQLSLRLRELSHLTWNAITLADRHGLGSEIIAHTSFKVPIPETVRDKRLIALRFASKNPMIGYRQARVFYILWLDHNFSVYPH